jgi:protein-S-isoprenylcysteine O-methyltransferase Ste14
MLICIMKSSAVVKKILTLIIFNAVILFSISGNFLWTGAWFFLIYLTISTFIGSGLVFSKKSGLLEERWGKKGNVKTWDKILMPVAAVICPLIIVITSSLEIRLLKTQSLSIYWQILGFITGSLSCVILTWSMLTNKFFSSNVRIQNDRGQTVISNGPYHYVRHPGYVGMLLYAFTMPLLLGSCWAFYPALGMIISIIIRTMLEDKTLQAELIGYKDYSENVRYRLMPGIW